MQRLHLAASDFDALRLLAGPFSLRRAFAVFAALERVAQVAEELAAASVSVRVRAQNRAVFGRKELAARDRLANWMNARPVLVDAARARVGADQLVASFAAEFAFGTVKVGIRAVDGSVKRSVERRTSDQLANRLARTGPLVIGAAFSLIWTEKIVARIAAETAFRIVFVSVCARHFSVVWDGMSRTSDERAERTFAAPADVQTFAQRRSFELVAEIAGIAAARSVI